MTNDSEVVYGLGLIGALVWYWQQASGTSEHVVAVLKAIVWPRSSYTTPSRRSIADARRRIE